MPAKPRAVVRPGRVGGHPPPGPIGPGKPDSAAPGRHVRQEVRPGRYGATIVIIATGVTFHLLLLSLCCAASSTASASGLPLTDVFVSGREGYHTYRIPALIVAGDGALLAFCEGRKKAQSDAGDIDLLVKRSIDGGKTWGPQEVVWDDGENTCGNPCPVVDRTTGTIWLPMTWNHGKDTENQIKQNTGKDTRRVFLTHSDDNGRTWAKPREITAEVKRPEWRWYATGPGVGIQLTRGPWKGRLLIPCDHSLVRTRRSGWLRLPRHLQRRSRPDLAVGRRDPPGGQRMPGGRVDRRHAPDQHAELRPVADHQGPGHQHRRRAHLVCRPARSGPGRAGLPGQSPAIHD